MTTTKSELFPEVLRIISSYRKSYDIFNLQTKCITIYSITQNSQFESDIMIKKHSAREANLHSV